MFLNFRHTLLTGLIKILQKYGSHHVLVSGRLYEISENVFNPKFYFTSSFMAEHINVTSKDEVLDMGTGSGIQAITAAQTAQRVLAVDINPEAVQFARANVKTHVFEKKILVLQSDLFSSIPQEYKFDVILFTPPYFDGIPKTFFEQALMDPDKKLIKKFFGAAKDYLKPGGYVQMLYSSIAGSENALEIAGNLGWKSLILAQSKTWSETFYIYKLTPVI